MTAYIVGHVQDRSATYHQLLSEELFPQQKYNQYFNAQFREKHTLFQTKSQDCAKMRDMEMTC